MPRPTFTNNLLTYSHVVHLLYVNVINFTLWDICHPLNHLQVLIPVAVSQMHRTLIPHILIKLFTNFDKNETWAWHYHSHGLLNSQNLEVHQFCSITLSNRKWDRTPVVHIPSIVKWYLLSSWLDSAPLGSSKSLCMFLTQSLPHYVGFLGLSLQANYQFLRGRDHVSLSLYRLIFSTAGTHQLLWTKLVELTLLPKVTDLLNTYHEDQSQPRRGILSWLTLILCIFSNG